MCAIRVYRNSFFEPFNCCKAQLVILTVKVQINKSYWLKLDSVKHITGTCKNQEGNKMERNNQGVNIGPWNWICSELKTAC